MMLGGVLMMKGMTMSASKGKVSYENAAAIAEQVKYPIILGIWRS